MFDDNPYAASTSSDDLESQRFALPIRVMIWWAVYLYPLVVVTMIHVCWAVVAVSLGRLPKFGEHPASEIVHSLVHIIGTATGLLLLTGPVAVPVGLVLSITQPFAKSTKDQGTVLARVVCPLTFVAILFVSVGILYFDPYGAWYWFVD